MPYIELQNHLFAAIGEHSACLSIHVHYLSFLLSSHLFVIRIACIGSILPIFYALGELM